MTFFLDKSLLQAMKSNAQMYNKPREKGRDLIQSYDKSTYTNVKRAKRQHEQCHRKVLLHSGCGSTKDGQFE